MKHPRLWTGIVTALVSVVAIIVIVVVAGLAVIYSGAVSVAATDSHWPVTAWVLGTTMENSVRAAARDVQVPPDYNNVDMQAARNHYNSMCLMCHGAPGAERLWVGKGLTPTPPELHIEAAQWSPAEIFWIVKHGIRMTGMPALVPTHSDKAIWELAAFVDRLPQMTPEEFKGFGRSAGSTSGAATGAHGDAGAGHSHDQQGAATGEHGPSR